MYRYFVSYKTSLGSMGNYEVHQREPIRHYGDIEKIQDEIMKGRIEKYGTEDKAVADDQVIITFWRKFDE